MNSDLSIYNNIKTDEIKLDISDTQAEIDQYENEISVLSKNPIENRLQIYMSTGRITQRKVFLENLNKILEYRQDLK